MKKSRFPEQQIAFILKQAEDSVTVEEVCRKAGISVQTYYRWRRKYGGLMPSEVERLRQLEEENIRLKHLVVNLSLDKEMLGVRPWRWTESSCRFDPLPGMLILELHGAELGLPSRRANSPQHHAAPLARSARRWRVAGLQGRASPCRAPLSSFSMGSAATA